MQMFVLAIQKLPHGGYAMNFTTDGRPVDMTQSYAARTTLHEIMQGIVHPLLASEFKEAPVFYQQAAWPTIEPPQQQPSYPAGDPPPAAEGDGMPNVVQSYANDGGLVGRLMRNGARIVMPALFLAGMWVSVHLQRWVV
jgi:hypothetical protein